jgi:MFS family permease
VKLGASSARIAQMRVAGQLRQPGLAALLGSEVVSMTGTTMTLIALPWFVLVTTGSPARTSLVMAAAAAGLAVCGIPGGWIASRLGARRWMLVSNIIRAPLIGLVPFLHETGALRFWMLPLIAFAVEAHTAPYQGAQSALLADLAGEDAHVLAQATALFQAASRATNLIGPGLAGILIAVVGASNILWIDAGTYLVAFVLTSFIPAAAKAAPDAEDLEHLLAGVRFVFRDRFFRLFVPVATVWEAAFSGLVILFPIIAYRRYDGDPHVAGGLLAAMGAGAIIGSIVAFRIVPRFRPIRLGTLALLGQILPVWVLVFHVPALAAAGAMAVSGFFQPIANAPVFSLITLRIPVALRPTVLTTIATFAMSGAPIAVALVGPLVIWSGVGSAVAAVAAILTASTLILVVWLPLLADEPTWPPRSPRRDSSPVSGIL